jgi:hypothetical protein
MEEMKNNHQARTLLRLIESRRWLPVALVFVAALGVLVIGVPELMAEPANQREQLQGFFGLPEEAITEKATVVLIQRIEAERIVTVLPGGMATKARSTFAFSSRIDHGSQVEDVNGDNNLDLIVDGVVLYNVGGEFALQPPTPTAPQGQSSNTLESGPQQAQAEAAQPEQAEAAQPEQAREAQPHQAQAEAAEAQGQAASGKVTTPLS